MSTNAIFVTEIVGSLVVFSLVAAWYAVPWLARLSPRDALTPLLVLHVTRTLGLTMLVPAVVDPNLPREFAVPAAYGDLAAATLALAAIAVLRARLGIALLVVWIFSVVGIADLVNAFIEGIRLDITNFKLGATWFIFTVLVPALLVTHFMIVTRLIRARSAGNEPPPRLADQPVGAATKEST